MDIDDEQFDNLLVDCTFRHDYHKCDAIKGLLHGYHKRREIDMADCSAITDLYLLRRSTSL